MEDDNENLQKLIHRIRIIQGHLRAIEQMISEKKNYADIIHQSVAVQKALKKLDMTLIKEYVETDMVEQFQNYQIEKSVKELLTLYEMK